MGIITHKSNTRNPAEWARPEATELDVRDHHEAVSMATQRLQELVQEEGPDGATRDIVMDVLHAFHETSVLLDDRDLVEVDGLVEHFAGIVTADM